MTLQLPEQEPCYFCEIISGQTDQWTVSEDADLTITLLNGRQFEVGQCVILPVRHTFICMLFQDAQKAIGALAHHTFLDWSKNGGQPILIML